MMMSLETNVGMFLSQTHDINMPTIMDDKLDSWTFYYSHHLTLSTDS